jgi:hypothetical integral membrane protein (TIGR02206 family)
MLSAAISPADCFRTGSVLHLASLLGCAALVLVFGRAGMRAAARGDTTTLRRLRHIAGYGGLVAWLVNTGYWFLPDRFAWGTSLPLHFCNLANLIGAAAVLGPWRFWKAILYFWACTLCIWAFLTPALYGGYATVEFWVFWGYHLFIPLAVVEVLVVQRFRPDLTDLRHAWWFTLVFLLLLLIPDNLCGWNYGFVGPSVPTAPTVIDLLGPYPWRLLWMALLATALYLLAWLPWRNKGKPGVLENLNL